MVEASKDADVLIFVIPHQFISRTCDQLAGKIKSTAIGLSLIKVTNVHCYATSRKSRLKAREMVMATVLWKDNSLGEN